MIEWKKAWKAAVARALAAYAKEKGIQVQMPAAEGIIVERPPRPEMGDLGFPMFNYAKLLRAGPPQVAQGLAKLISEDPLASGMGTATAAGPYLNVGLPRAEATSGFLSAALADSWGKGQALEGKRLMIEFSGPNTNKPLHLGHLRNDAIGESISRICAAAGARVRKVDIFNDRGINICKSMLSYLRYGEGRTPEGEGMKPDHFVAKYYVLFNQLKEEDATAEEQAQELVRKWEAGDPEIRALWKRMNDWTIGGIKATYRRTGVSFDQYYLESDTYLRGREEVLKGLDQGIFHKAEDGSVQVDLEDVGLDRKVLLRADGTSIYITQDLGLAIFRYEDWPFDSLVYVVGNEQQWHFKVLFEILKRLGHPWADQLRHLSYGMVNLPSGRMKTREGTVVDGDDFIDEVAALARAEIESKGREESIEYGKAIAEKIALGAIHYFLLQVSPVKDMLFDPEASLSFTGDTGPYLQYMGARASSILRKHAAGEGKAGQGIARPDRLASDADWALCSRVAGFPEAIDAAATSMEPSVMAAYLHDLAAEFSSWYRENPVLNNSDEDLAASRIDLVKAVKATLEIGMNLICVPFLESM